MNTPIVKGFSYFYLSRCEDVRVKQWREMIGQKAAQSGIELVGEFVECGQSGKTYPQFQEMVATIRGRDDISAVVVPRLDQTHDHYQAFLTNVALQKLGVVLVSASDTVDPAPFDYMFRQVSAAFHEAQYGHLRGPRRRRAA
jgi:hypothetical protein